MVKTLDFNIYIHTVWGEFYSLQGCTFQLDGNSKYKRVVPTLTCIRTMAKGHMSDVFCTLACGVAIRPGAM